MRLYFGGAILLGLTVALIVAVFAAPGAVLGIAGVLGAGMGFLLGGLR